MTDQFVAAPAERDEVVGIDLPAGIVMKGGAVVDFKRLAALPGVATARRAIGVRFEVMLANGGPLPGAGNAVRLDMGRRGRLRSSVRRRWHASASLQPCLPNRTMARAR